MFVYPGKISFKISLFFLSGWLFISCATPTSPTGGPRDEEGPTITSTEPETGATNFNKREITLHFSEFVDRGSLANAIIVEPDIGITYNLDWGRKSVTIEFEDKLPDLTTLIVTIGTDLKDMNGNKLASPRKIAVSTGPEIDEGKLTGRILDAQTGKGIESSRILLYRSPADLTQKANYSAQTDTGGVFQFSYLRQGDYKVFWVDDRNRNRIWEPERERAQPFGKEIVTLEKAEEDTLGNLYVANADTARPVLQGLGLFSSKRLRMRFSENIKLADSTRMTISDTLGNKYSEAYPLYISSSEPYVLFAQSRKSLSPDTTYQILVEHIVDEAGNLQDSSSYSFTGSAQKDTTLQRIIKQTHPSGIYPSEAVEMIYAKPIDNRIIVDSLKVVEGTELYENWSGTEIINNVFRILPDGEWKTGVEYEFRIWNPAGNVYRNIKSPIWYASQLGELDIRLADSTRENKYNLLLKTDQRGVMEDTAFSKQITVKDLPPLNLQLVLFEDKNGNNKWDHGQVEPFVAPEPYFIRNNIPVKEGFTSDLTVSLDQYSSQ